MSHDPPENPPDNLKTHADRMTGTPLMVWVALGLAVIVGFSVLVFWVMGFRPQ